MKNQNEVDAIKKVKNIAAVLYMLVLTFVVGGSYINQQHIPANSAESQSNQQ